MYYKCHILYVWPMDQNKGLKTLQICSIIRPEIVCVQSYVELLFYFSIFHPSSLLSQTTLWKNNQNSFSNFSCIFLNISFQFELQLFQFIRYENKLKKHSVTKNCSDLSLLTLFFNYRLVT